MIRYLPAALLLLLATPAAAANINVTVTPSELVVVAGTPRIAIDVGDVTRYAIFAGGSGTSTLTFSYAVAAGDFDANGIEILSPLQLNGTRPVSRSRHTPPPSP